MGITPITWEEFETYKTVKTPDNLYIREHNGKYYTVFELGIASVRHIFEIQADDFKEYLNGQHSADDILFKAQNDAWPPKISQLEADRMFLKENPELLLNDEENQKLFSRKELEEILPKEAKILASNDN